MTKDGKITIVLQLAGGRRTVERKWEVSRGGTD